MNTTPMTDAKYKQVLTGFIKAHTTQRDNCQALIIEGIRQYKDSGRTTRLSLFLEKSVVVKSIPTVTIKDFIKEHTDLAYKPNKAGDYQFIRADKNADKKANIPEEMWYGWKKAKHNAVKEKDYVKAMTNDIKQALKRGVSKAQLVRGLLEAGLTINDVMEYTSPLEEVAKAA